jgi:hypothetical protein
VFDSLGQNIVIAGEQQAFPSVEFTDSAEELKVFVGMEGLGATAV